MSQHDRRRILITGVAGFVGSNLARRLLDDGWAVTGIDNLSQGTPANLESMADDPGFTFVAGDVRDYGALRAAMHDCSHVVHLAAYKIPRYTDALDTLLVNSEGANHVFRAAAEHGCAVIAASTSDVYGMTPDLPMAEDSMLVIGPPSVRRWSYAISKMFSEQLLFAYHERFKLGFAIIRFFGLYGPNQNLTWWGGPQSVFINAALDRAPMPIHGDGLQTRSLTYIDDAVEALVRCVNATAPLNDVFNIGSPDETTILALARLIWRLAAGDDEPKMEFVPYDTFGKYQDVRRRLPDLSKARQQLGYHPRIDLHEGLTRTIKWQSMRRRQLQDAPPPAVRSKPVQP